MTVSAAIWVLEHESAWVKRNFSRTDSDNDPSAFIALSTAGMVQSALISSTPYYAIYSQASAFGWVADDLAYAKKYPLWSKVWPQTGHWYNHHPGLLSWARKTAGRKLAVRIGARAIPYVGWALLIWDAWNVGKWIGEKTNPFD